MTFEVLLHSEAEGFLDIAENRAGKRLRILSSAPEKGERLKHTDSWLLRIGDHRAVYEMIEARTG